ncbi:unnamed protein product [Coffea canephora]|uniref:SOSEKI DIX-like domain-containing protein n=1 Tax=Coffea canephora TaxID=49390 RepID=A0A068UFE0_COFCA|nr:unnamed protein product [Coffea canephora]
MAVANSRPSTELLMPKKWNERSDRSPERAKICSEQPKFNSILDGKVPVIYYLARNGHLEHPHFIQVPLSSSHGLYLRGTSSSYFCGVTKCIDVHNTHRYRIVLQKELNLKEKSY